MEILVNHVADMISMGWTPERKKVEAELVKLNRLSAWFRLPDGHVVKRRVGRDYLGMIAWSEAPEAVIEEAEARGARC